MSAGADPVGRVADPARLAAVLATGLLDTPPEESFDHLARLAAALLGAPRAFVTLVDARRSFWKSAIGVPAGTRETAVEESFCQYLVESGEDLAIGDARIEERTRDNPSVTRAGVRAWAGSPLCGPGGDVLGSFCVVDIRPRRWSNRDAEVLRALATAASGEIRLRAALAASAAEREALRALLMQAPAVIWRLRGPEHLVELVNPMALATVGNREIAFGRPMAESVPEFAEQGYVAVFDRVYASGEPSVADEAPIMVDLGEGERRQGFYTYAVTPTRDGAGAVDGILLHAVDVTAQVRARQAESALRERAEAAVDRLARLQRVTAALAGALGEREVSAVVIGEAVPALGAQAALVALRRGEHFEVACQVGYPPEVLVEGSVFPLDDRRPVARAIRTGEPEWLERRSDWTRHYPPPAPSALGAVAFTLPLLVEGEAIGALAFRFAAEERILGPEERELALALAAQCAQALERARLYEAEHEVAEALQARLLPHELPRAPGVAVAARYRASALPGQVGGDFYDAFALPAGRIGLVIGDVVGRGPQAAAVMGQLRSVLRAFALDGAGPAEVLDRLDRFAIDLPGALASTVAYAVLDPAARELRHASAGHPPPLLQDGNGRARHLWGGRGGPLGLGSRHQEELVELDDGPARVILATDGLLERSGQPIDDGLARLAAAAGRAPSRDPDTLLEQILAQVLGDRAPEDDVALLALRIAPAALQIELEAEPSALSGLRRSVRDWLSRVGASKEEVCDLLLATDEAAANAMEHAYLATEAGGIRVSVGESSPGEVAIEVRDRGRWRATPAPGERGRGVRIMRAVCDSVTLGSTTEGTCVSLRRRLAPLVSLSDAMSPPPATGDDRPAPPRAPHPATLDVAREGEDLVVRLAGELDHASARRLGAELAEPPSGPLVVDLAAVAFIDSAGMRLVAELAWASGGPAALIPPRAPAPRRALEVSGLLEALRLSR